jgi:hypothetical protein
LRGVSASGSKTIDDIRFVTARSDGGPVEGKTGEVKKRLIRMPRAVVEASMTVTLTTLLGPTWWPRSGSAGMLADQW